MSVCVTENGKPIDCDRCDDKQATIDALVEALEDALIDIADRDGLVMELTAKRLVAALKLAKETT